MRMGSLSEPKEPTYKTRTLQDVGTRYTHLQELRDFWLEGLEVISNIPNQFVSKAQDIKKEQLNAGVYLLTNELERLADWDKEKFKLKRTIDDLNLIKIYEETSDGQDCHT